MLSNVQYLITISNKNYCITKYAICFFLCALWYNNTLDFSTLNETWYINNFTPNHTHEMTFAKWNCFLLLWGSIMNYANFHWCYQYKIPIFFRFNDRRESFQQPFNLNNVPSPIKLSKINKIYVVIEIWLMLSHNDWK